VSDVLRGLADTLEGTEDDLLSSLVVMGETDAQRVVDGWVDQVVDLLRAVDEVTAQHRSTLARASSRYAAHDAAGPDAGTRPAVDDSVPSEHR
jgi:hypothetical protein